MEQEKLEFDYQTLTLGVIESFKNLSFECDGDNKKIIVKGELKCN